MMNLRRCMLRLWPFDSPKNKLLMLLLMSFWKFNYFIAMYERRALEKIVRVIFL